MLEELQKKVINDCRDYNQITYRVVNQAPTTNSLYGASTRFSIGYKIEKYLNNDVTSPVQTVYVSSLNNLDYLDSQLKFGSKYIYKVYHLVVVLGSSYRYGTTLISNENGTLQTTTGELTGNSANDKYEAQTTVTVSPALSVLEIPIKEFETMFFDEPPLPPEVSFFNETGKPNSLKISFKSNLNEIYDRNQTYTILTEADKKIESNLFLSKDSVYSSTFTNRYAIGAFEIYRLDSPPKSINDFEGNYLTTVDQRSNLLWMNRTKNRLEDHEDFNGFFEDTILPNRKYYYLFRSLSYHRTPSNPTEIFEVEIAQDADETKLVIDNYVFPEHSSYSYIRHAKRILKIVPNFDQLVFQPDGTLGRLQNKLVTGPGGETKFKIRITSKHTGKKMDFNVTFKVEEEK